MDIKKLLTPKQYDICQKEHYYHTQAGTKKSILQIAIDHNFVHRKEKQIYNLDLLKEYEIIVVKEDTKSLYVEVKKLLGSRRLKEFRQKVGKEVVQTTIPVREFDKKFKKIISIDPDSIEKKIKQFNANDAKDLEVVEIFEMILRYGVKQRVSDIHINPYEEFCWLRFRVDGKVESKYLISRNLAERFSFIIKEKSNMDLINVQVPQSGSFELKIDDSIIDFRMEVAPSKFGENIVIRLLNRENSIKSLNNIFPNYHPMTEHICNFIKKDFKKSYIPSKTL